jgi:hypothetical protein
MSRENAVVNVRWDDGFAVMTVDVIGSGKPAIVVDTRKASGVMRNRLMAYGAEVRITRAAALKSNEKTGKPASAADKWDKVNRMALHVVSGTDEWNAEREGGRIGLDETLLSQAMAVAFPSKTAEEIRAKVTGATKDERMALRMDKRIAPEYDKLVAAATADVDVGGLLAGW